MFFPYYIFKCRVSFFILAIQLLICRASSLSASSLNLTNEYLHHICRNDQGKYQPGSEYEKELNRLTRTESKSEFNDGFTHISNGEGPNTITIIFQCRGDSYKANCRSCYTTAFAEFHRRCPRNKGGIIWYDQCFLDVSMINYRSPRKINYENVFSLHNPNNVRGNTKSFNTKTRDFLYKLIVEADKPTADGLNFLYYAAGEMRLGKEKLYAMVQCANDILSCRDCLEWSIGELSKCCDGKQGARVLSTSCNLRYELYPFLRT